MGFKLQIVTPDGSKFDGEIDSLIVKTDEGDVEILRGHTDYFAALGTGKAKLRSGTESRLASASGGFISVNKGEVRLVTTTFEFADEIDLARANAAKENAERAIASAKDEKSLAILKAKLARALSRISVKESSR